MLHPEVVPFVQLIDGDCKYKDDNAGALSETGR